MSARTDIGRRPSLPHRICEYQVAQVQLGRQSPVEKALVQFARAQGRLHARFKGAGWQRMLKETLKITEHKQARQEIKHALAQVEKAVIAMRGR